MKVERRFIDSIDFEFNSGIIISLWQCLTEIILWKRYNWNTWQFINIEFENDIMMGAYEFTFAFLCCGFRIRIPHSTEKSIKNWKEIDERLANIKEEKNNGKN